MITTTTQTNKPVSKRPVSAAKECMENKRHWQSVELDWQLTLIDLNESVSYAMETGRITDIKNVHFIMQRAAACLTPSQMREVAEERAAENHCGYPPCTQVPSKVKGRYKISLIKEKVIDQSDLKLFCSERCLTAFRHYITQLSSDPSYVRVPSTSLPHISLLPINSTPENESSLESIIEKKKLELLSKASVAASPKDVAAVEEELRKLHLHQSPPSILSPIQENEDASLHSNAPSLVSAVLPKNMDTNPFLPIRVCKQDLPVLSVFARSWATLSRMVTPLTKRWLTTTFSSTESSLVLAAPSSAHSYLDVDDSGYEHDTLTPSALHARQEIFVQKFAQTLRLIQRSCQTEGIVVAVLEDFALLVPHLYLSAHDAVLPPDVAWVMGVVFLMVLGTYRVPALAGKLKGKWLGLMQKVNLGIYELDTLCHVFEPDR